MSMGMPNCESVRRSILTALLFSPPQAHLLLLDVHDPRVPHLLGLEQALAVIAVTLGVLYLNLRAQAS